MKRTLAENYEGLMARRAKYTPLKRCCTEDDVADSMLSLILHNRFRHRRDHYRWWVLASRKTQVPNVPIVQSRSNRF